MGQVWYRLYSVDPATQVRTRVPVFHEDGSRDIYHNYDYIYYGMTLPWRRATIGFNQWQDDEQTKYYLDGIKLIAKYHMRDSKLPEPAHYYFEIVSDQSMDLSLPMAQRYESKVVKSGEFIL